MEGYEIGIGRQRQRGNAVLHHRGPRAETRPFASVRHFPLRCPLTAEPPFFVGTECPVVRSTRGQLRQEDETMAASGSHPYPISRSWLRSCDSSSSAGRWTSCLSSMARRDSGQRTPLLHCLARARSCLTTASFALSSLYSGG